MDFGRTALHFLAQVQNTAKAEVESGTGLPGHVEQRAPKSSRRPDWCKKLEDESRVDGCTFAHAFPLFTSFQQSNELELELASPLHNRYGRRVYAQEQARTHKLGLL